MISEKIACVLDQAFAASDELQILIIVASTVAILQGSFGRAFAATSRGLPSLLASLRSRRECRGSDRICRKLIALLALEDETARRCSTKLSDCNAVVRITPD